MLPGDKPLYLKEERLKCPELLFQPLLANKEIDGIHKYTFDSIMKCDNDIKKKIYLRTLCWLVAAPCLRV